MATAAEVEAYILQKVEADADFRERLVADPKGVIEAETKGELPDDVLVFVQKAIATTQQEMAAASIDEPLSADELKQVMGGSYCDDFDPANPFADGAWDCLMRG